MLTLTQCRRRRPARWRVRLWRGLAVAAALELAAIIGVVAWLYR